MQGLATDSLAATFSKGVVIPEYVFFIFQLTFACITPALIVGAFAERIKFGAVLLFTVLWFTFSYLPIAHMVWFWAGPDAYTDADARRGRHGRGRIPVPERRARLRGRHRRAHQRRHRRSRGRTDARQAHRLSHDRDAAAQRRDGDDRRLAAVGRLVRLQRRLRPRGERLHGHGVRQHDPRHRRGRARVVVRRVDPPRHADDARWRVGCRRGPRRHHAGLRLGGPDGCDRDRRDRRPRLPLGGVEPEEQARLRRLARRVRRPLRRRNRRRAADGRVLRPVARRHRRVRLRRERRRPSTRWARSSRPSCGPCC